MIITALLTGRGNSTLKNKNILPVFGKPILWYPCSEAKKCKNIDNFFVSSDDTKILNLAEKLGFIKIKRPKKLSKKNSIHRDVLLHSLDFLKKKKINTKILVVLLANSASIKSDWIEKCILKLKKNKNATAVVTVVLNNDKHPFRAKK